MFSFKQVIIDSLSEVLDIDKQELFNFLEVPKDSNMGDYAFACFNLAKIFKKSPQVIASDIKEKLVLDENIFSKVEVVSGYINFFVNKEKLAFVLVNEFKNSDSYGLSNFGEGKTVVIDYSAPNIAKPFHIGHLRSTVIGGALYKIYKYLGYNVVGINHLGDYGTQFGKMIEGYTLWGDEYDLKDDSISKMLDIYVRINKLCKEDERVLERCRDNFKKLEDGDPYCTKIWEMFKELSLEEFKKVYDLLDSHFDSWNGEAFYSDKMDEVVDILNKSGKLVTSEGAKIIDLEYAGIDTPIIIKKSNDSTTYATRDLAAILYRARTYDFDKALYVTSYEQTLHFKQVFECAKLLNIDEKYSSGLCHIPFGMVLLPSGKMSTREGTIIKLEDLLSEAVDRALKIIDEKNPTLNNKFEVAKKVGIGAVIFNDLYNSRIKDEVFDWNTVLNFQGESGPYVQYTYVRIRSIIEKAGYSFSDIKNFKDISLKNLLDTDSINIFKLIYNFEDILKQVTEKNEPYILSRYLINLSKTFSNFYTNNKVIVESEELKKSRIFLIYMVASILETGCNLLGIKMPNEM